MSARLFLNICLGAMIGLFIVTSVFVHQQLDDTSRQGQALNLARRQEVLLQNMVDQSRDLMVTEGEGRRQALCREFSETVWLFDASLSALENGGTTTDDSGRKITIEKTSDPRVLESVHTSYGMWAEIGPSLLAVGDGRSHLDSPSSAAALKQLQDCRQALARTLSHTSLVLLQLGNSSVTFGPMIKLLATILFLVIACVGLVYVNSEQLQPIFAWLDSLRHGVTDPTSRRLIAENHSEIQAMKESIDQVCGALNSIGEHLSSGVTVAATAEAAPAGAASPAPAPAAAPTQTPVAEPEPEPEEAETTSVDSNIDAISDALDEAFEDEPEEPEDTEVVKVDPSLNADGGAWGAPAEPPAEAEAEPEPEPESPATAAPKNLFVLNGPAKKPGEKTDDVAKDIGDAFDKAVEAEEVEEKPAEPDTPAVPEAKEEPAETEPPAAEEKAATPKNLFVLKKTTAPAAKPQTETEEDPTPEADASTEETKTAEAPAPQPKNLFVLKKPRADKTEEATAETKADTAPEPEPEPTAEPEAQAAPEIEAKPEPAAEEPAAETEAAKAEEATDKPPPPKNLFVLGKPKAKKKEEPATEQESEAAPEPAAELEPAPEAAPQAAAEAAPEPDPEPATEEKEVEPKPTQPKNLFVLKKPEAKKAAEEPAPAPEAPVAEETPPPPAETPEPVVEKDDVAEKSDEPKASTPKNLFVLKK